MGVSVDGLLKVLSTVPVEFALPENSADNVGL